MNKELSKKSDEIYNKIINSTSLRRDIWVDSLKIAIEIMKYEEMERTNKFLRNISDEMEVINDNLADMREKMKYL